MSDVRKYCLWDVQRIAERDLSYSENLQLIASLFKEWQLIEMYNYVKQNNLNFNTVKNRIKAGKLPSIKLSETIFIIQKLIV